MNITDVIKNVNTYIGDTSTDRVSASDRYQAVTEGTAWLLEELGNEHMTDRTEVEYLPTVVWYKMSNLTPYLLTAGQLRFKEEEGNRVDFRRVEPRDLATMPDNQYAYAIEQYNGHAYMGIKVPSDHTSTKNYGVSTDLLSMDEKDALTYTGTNASGIFKEANAIRFDMTSTGVTKTSIGTTSEAKDLTNYEGVGFIILEVEIPDTTDVSSVSVKFGDNLATDYWLGVVTEDVNGNPLTVGVNTVKFRWADLTVVGTPTVSSVTEWEFAINHLSSKPAVDGFKFSDLRVAKPIYLTFKYIFYRVGKDSTGDDIIEFTADTDVPFFMERYPQYRFAVAHKAAAVLFRSLVLPDSARDEDRQALGALDRYRKNFSGDRDMPSSTFKPFGINLRGRRIIRRR